MFFFRFKHTGGGQWSGGIWDLTKSKRWKRVKKAKEKKPQERKNKGKEFRKKNEDNFASFSYYFENGIIQCISYVFDSVHCKILGGFKTLELINKNIHNYVFVLNDLFKKIINVVEFFGIPLKKNCTKKLNTENMMLNPLETSIRYPSCIRFSKSLIITVTYFLL